MSLQLLKDAMDGGLRVGALVHEKKGTTCRVEVVTVDSDRLLAVAEPEDDTRKLFAADAAVRIELPKEGAVLHVPGHITEVRPSGSSLEVEIACPNGAEERQRRTDIRVAAECRVRLQDGADWEETLTVNLSAGGLLIAKGGASQVGDVVDIEFEMDAHRIRCRAEVVRRGVKSGGMASRINAALKFVDLADADRERIALHVLAQQAKQKAAARARR